ncbi:hypothetical protein [Bacillus phage vB_BceM_Bc431v3]|uniref:Uncharacterized protein n=1 Tax=Bacillus phage vB_BceM_Bc431v3 TaxID=1195072 RepID=M4HQ16_9CAUD|nr:hypothetical protein K201_gp147 [Bacillus phage vB_BceM_Bc431v3]AFQ96455.1 hypothetical protein [Bacillus phage vB_BceM_Bc431v3]
MNTTTLNTDQLQVVWEQLDGACEALERLQDNGISTGMVDFSSVVALKNEVEELMQKQGKELSFKDIVETNKIPFNLDALKRDLKAVVDGKFMVRQYRGYKGLENRGVFTYNVHFDVPTPNNQEAIKQVLGCYDVDVQRFRISEGSYGYIIGFKVKEEGK